MGLFAEVGGKGVGELGLRASPQRSLTRFFTRLVSEFATCQSRRKSWARQPKLDDAVLWNFKTSQIPTRAHHDQHQHR